MSNRTVFDNSGIAHAWARGADEARTSNGNFYSRGRKLYSYGSHFVVGVRMGAATFALNSDGYSPSTGRHKSEALYAAHGTIHFLPNLTAIADKLAYLARDDRKPDKRDAAEIRKPDKRDAAEIRKYLTDNARKLDASAAAWLAELAGIRGDAFKRATDERARLNAKAAKDAARVKRETERRLAIRLADMGTREYTDHIRTVAADWRGADGIARAATDLRRSRIVAKREGLSLKRLNAIRAKLATLESLDSVRVARIANKQKEVREHIRKVRSWTRADADLRATLDSGGMGRLAYSAGRLAELVPYMRPAMLALKADAEAERVTRAEREQAEAAARYEREDAERREGHAKRLAGWLAGEGGRGGFRFSDDRGGALLRAVDVKRDDSGAIIGGTLETSHGADVPLVHAIKAFRFVKLLREKGESWARNGRTVRVGHYQIDSVDGEGFTAGCHRINAGEIDRLAALLGVADVAPCDAREPSAAAA